MRPADGRLPVAIALVAALPALAFAVPTLAAEVPDFFDPCHFYGDEGAPGAQSPGDRCYGGWSASGETRAGVATRLALVQGGTILAAGLGVAGAVARRPAVTGLGALMLLVVSVPLMLGRFAPFTLASSALFLLAAFVDLRAGKGSASAR